MALLLNDVWAQSRKPLQNFVSLLGIDSAKKWRLEKEKEERRGRRISMCQPVFPSISLQELAARHRWRALQALPMAGRLAGPARTAMNSTAAGVVSAGSVKLCVCSPTRHPGSFRCRYHHAGYVWRGSRAQKTSL
ncbi:hypothetical protein Ancab_016786 [Ancistrocladus abbreviatus]